MADHKDLSKEAFEELAAHVGLHVSAEHLDVLRGEVNALLARVAPIADVDVSEVPPEQASLAPSTNGGAA